MTNRRARLLAAPLALTFTLVLSACSGDDDSGGSDNAAGSAPAASKDAGSSDADGEMVEVTIEDFAFSPKELTVPAGTMVRITNKDSAEHDWDEKGGAFQTDLLGQDESTEITLDEPGTFTVFCSVHPQMTGSVTVE